MLWIHMPRLPGTKNELILVLCTKFRSANAGFGFYDDDAYSGRRMNSTADASDYIVDIREYDVPYHVRVAIDKSWSLLVL